MRNFLLIIVVFWGLSYSPVSNAQPKHEWKSAESAGYTYKYVTNDPSNARYYTLKNGLTVILSPSKLNPRIQTYIAIKAGSNTEPTEHTGLTHYLVTHVI